MQYFLVFLLLGFLILLHETGHFLGARLMGVPVASFSIGFGPVLFSRKSGDTEYRICLIPLGGYVEPAVEDDEAFYALAWEKRVVFALFGPLFNILGAIAGYSLLNYLSSQTGFHALMVKPLVQTFDSMGMFLRSLTKLFSSHTNMSGIIGILVQGGNFVGFSLKKLLQFSIMLNLNLAVFNLLPLPPLDGGHLIFYFLEKLDRRVLRYHIPLAAAGWFLLIGLMLYSTGLDLIRYI